MADPRTSHTATPHAPEAPEEPARKPQGFAAISPERRREIASAGGKAAQARGTAHRFTPEEAAAAGRKGGAKMGADRKHMAEIGRKGGQVRHTKPEGES